MQSMHVFHVYICCKSVCCFGAELPGMRSALLLLFIYDVQSSNMSIIVHIVSLRYKIKVVI